MTTAGTISVGVEIVGRDLAAKLAAQIRKDLAPQIAALNKEVTESARQSATATKKQASAADDLKTATTNVTKAQREFTAAVDLFGKKSPQAEQAYKRLGSAQSAHSTALVRAAVESRTSTDSQINDYRRLAREAEESAARQAAAARAAGIGGGGAGGRGGGGGGGGRGGIGGFLTGPVGLNSIALAASALPAATLAVTNLVGAVQQLGQAGLVLPGVFAGIASSVGTAALGFSGMKDAVTALNKAAASGDPKELKKAAEALKDMDPAAVEVAKSVSALTQGPLKELRQAVQGKMFAGVGQEITDLSTKLLPTFKTGLSGIGDAWNQTFKTIGKVAGSDSTKSILDRIFGNTAEGQKRANAAIEPLVKGFGTLAAAGTDVLPRLADALTSVATRFSDFITKADGDGRLAKWIDEGITGVGQLGNTFLNIGKIITSITKAAGGDGGLLKLLDDGSTKLAAFLGSADGQKRLTAFFTEAREDLKKWIPILGDVAKVIGDVFTGFQQWGDTIRPVVAGIASTLGSMPTAISAVVTAFIAWKSISGIADLLGSLGKVSNSLDDIGTKSGKLGKGGRGGLGGGLGAAGAGLFVGGAMQNLSGDVSGLSALSAIGGGAALGGELAGPIGLVIGALAGGLTALVPVISEQFRKEAETQRALGDKGAPGVRPQIAPAPGIPIAPGPAIEAPFQAIKPSATTQQNLLVPQALNGANVVGGPQGTITVPPLQGNGLEQLIGQATDASKIVQQLGDQVKALPTGEVVIKENTPEIIQRLAELGLGVKNLPNGQMVITVVYRDQNGRPIDPSQLVTPSVIGSPGRVPFGRGVGGGRAGGGVLPGYSPGVDNMLVPMSGGEGVVIPEAMRALGPSWLYGINSRFRAGLSRRGYADGGVVGADGLLTNPGDQVITLLTEIRDALNGKASGPISDTARSTGDLAKVAGVKELPFGGDIGKGALAGAIDALGGDSSLLIPGFDKQGQRLSAPGGGAGVLGSADYQGIAAALAAFAKSGNTADISGFGLNAGSPVVSAIVSARNKKKGGLGDEDIAGLVQQIVGGGGFNGVLDPSNSALIKSLTSYRNKLGKTGGVPSAPGGASTGVALTGLTSPVPAGSNLAAMYQLAAQGTSGKYSFGSSDLAGGLADCSGAVSDLIEVLTKGQSDPGRLFSTSNAADVLQSLGFQPGTAPGAFNVGFRNGGPGGGHMAATLPNGMAFEAGGQNGGIVLGPGQGAANPSFTDHFFLPVGADGGVGALGAGNPLGYSGGGPVPVYIVDGPGFGGGIGQKLGGDLANSALQAGGQVLSNVSGDVIDGLNKATQLEKNSTLSKPTADTEQLLKGGNPAGVASLAGYRVPDFTRAGGDSASIMGNGGPGFTANGQVFSDTAALIQRSFTDMEAANQARHEQMMAILDGIKTQLSESVLKPIIQSAVQAAMSAAGSAAGGGGGGGGGSFIPGLASGGGIWGGTPGRDSVPAMLMPGEHVLTTSDVARMGGQGGVYAFRNALARTGGVRGFATGGGVSGNDTVGADFFGVSQIPIIGAIINLIVKTLLEVIGVNVEVADTLNEISGDFRKFRGDFKAFEASGRLMNDTSGLVDRTGSSEQKAVDERVRIFKQVLTGLIKYIIQKIIIPITQAILQTLLSSASSAVSGAVSGGVNTVAPGAGGIAGGLVSGLMNSAGSAAINIGGELISNIAGAAVGPIISLFTDGFMGMFGKLLTPILSGGLGGFLSMLFPFLAFDSGGMANGMGMLPKATIQPERVLSPRQTTAFEDMVRANFGAGAMDNSKSVTAEIHLHGSQATAEAVRDNILALLS